jgi:hypothetical protein
MTKLPRQLPADQLQSKWAAIIDPVITNPITAGLQLTSIKLSIGVNTIDHKLNRKLQGYIVSSMYDTYSNIFRQASQMPETTIVLNSSAATTIDLYVW